MAQQAQASSTSQKQTWDPSCFLRAQAKGKGRSTSNTADGSMPSDYAVILLNQRVPSEQRSLFRTVWQGATVRVCADGGANRLLAHASRYPSDELALPHAIVGDLDSISDSTRAHYSSLHGVEICHRPSQYATDLQKSIQWVEDWEAERHGNALNLVIIGGLSGRLDQTAHTLHCLWKLSPPLQSQGGYEDPEADPGEKRGGVLRKRLRTWVIGEGSLAVLLWPGVHDLVLPCPPLDVACGILPFGVTGGSGTGAAAKVRTKGLEWDLDPAQPQSLGGFLSTSNHVVYPASKSDDGGRISHRIATVTIETDKPIYWSVELADGAEVIGESGECDADG